MRSPWAIVASGLVVAAVLWEGSAAAQTSASALFEQGRWPEAAVALADVGQSTASQADKELAQYRLGIAFYRMQLRLPAYAIFSEIADKPQHSKHAEALLWLTNLDTDLPEPADVMERVGRFSEAEISRFNNENQREIYWHLNYMMARYQQRNRRYEEALHSFSHVAVESKFYLRSQFLSGIANVQLRKSVPATQAFQRMLAAIAEGGQPEATRMADLANLSMARVYYSASIRLDENGAPAVDASKLSASVKFYRKVDVTSGSFLDALFEESWALYMAGDYGSALGNLAVLESSDAKSRYAEGAVLAAMITFLACRYDETTKALVKMRATYEPIRAELARAESALSGEDDAAHVALVRRELARSGSIVADVLSDRAFAGHLAYDAYLADEKKRFDATPASFKSSGAGNDAKDVLSLAHDIETRNIGHLAHDRVARARQELDEHLRDATKLLIDVTAAQRNQLDAAIAGSQLTPAETRPLTAAPLRASSWPINGQSAPPTSYRAPLTSKCGR